MAHRLNLIKKINTTLNFEFKELDSCFVILVYKKQNITFSTPTKNLNLLGAL
jgi:hypothetical protein